MKTSYMLSKRLKEFLGERAPEPIEKSVGYNLKGDPYFYDSPKYYYHSYELQDLLSKPFCRAFAFALGDVNVAYGAVAEGILRHYYDGGFAAVEKTLLKIMGDK